MRWRSQILGVVSASARTERAVGALKIPWPIKAGDLTSGIMCAKVAGSSEYFRAAVTDQALL